MDKEGTPKDELIQTAFSYILSVSRDDPEERQDAIWDYMQNKRQAAHRASDEWTEITAENRDD